MRENLRLDKLVQGLAHRFRAKREQFTSLEIRVPEGQGQNLALTVLHLLFSLDSGFNFYLHQYGGRIVPWCFKGRPGVDFQKDPY